MVSNSDYEIMHKAHAEALSKILELEAELAEARLDRARMDWLELQVGSDNVRAAIDAAMEKGK